VARHRHALDERLKRLMAVLVIVTLAATGAGALSMWLVVRNGLRPLDNLATRIESIDRENLQERIELAGAPLELRVVVERLNQLLDRVNQTVLNERRFNADVAHELRTPLAGLQTTLEVCVSRTRTPAEYERSMARCLEIVQTLRGLVDDLLMLARADAGEIRIQAGEFDLGELVQDRWSNVESAAKARRLSVELNCYAAPLVSSDRGLLGIVLGNLLENAVAYADEGGWVRIEAASADGNVVLTVANSGCTLSDEQVQRATDRFWRADTARTGGGMHCGLGLAICREITSLLGTKMSLSASSDGVFSAMIVLPIARQNESRPRLAQAKV
jgi:two-component system heavy metal sensor histidine kinase CusS